MPLKQRKSCTPACVLSIPRMTQPPGKKRSHISLKKKKKPTEKMKQPPVWRNWAQTSTPYTQTGRSPGDEKCGMCSPMGKAGRIHSSPALASLHSRSETTARTVPECEEPPESRRKMDPGPPNTPRDRSAATAARAPARNCAVLIPLKRRLFPLLSPLKGCFSSSSSLPSAPFFSLLLLSPHAGLFSVEESWTLTAPPP